MKNTRKRSRNFLREWRKYRDLTLVQIAERVGMSHGQLSRIERGLQDYNQTLLEILAEEYQCAVPDLIMRNPLDDNGIWSIWDQAKPGEKRQIIEIARALLKTGNDN